MVASACRSHGHAEGSVIAAYTVVDRDGDGEDAGGGVGMGLGRQAAGTVGVEDGMGRAVAPSHRDLPRAVRAGIGEGAKSKGFTRTLACRLGRWRADHGRDVGDSDVERSVVADRAVVDGEGDGEAAMGGIGMRLGRQTSRAGGVEDGMGRAIAPSHRDLPRAVRAGIGEGAKGKTLTVPCLAVWLTGAVTVARRCRR